MSRGPRRHRGVIILVAASMVTLLLAILRELSVAQRLQASADADLFFRGLVVVTMVRTSSIAVFRTRWMTTASDVTRRTLLVRGLSFATTIGMMGAVAVIGLVGLSAVAEPTTWVLASTCLVAACSGHIRALAERDGRDVVGYIADWGAAVGVILGVSLYPGDAAVAAACGLAMGMTIGTLPAWMAPSQARTRTSSGVESGRRSVWLWIDALLYLNLGLVDSAASHLLESGSLARLMYAGLFVNAWLLLGSNAASLLGLRAAASSLVASGPLVRASLVAGLGVAAIVGLTAVGLQVPWVTQHVDATVGWPMTTSIVPLVWWSAPYAGLRIVNLVGRSRALVRPSLRRVLWIDLAGLGARIGALALSLPHLGVLAFPLATAMGELVQLGAWLPMRERIVH